MVDDVHVDPKQGDMVGDAAADRDVHRGCVGAVLLWALHLDQLVGWRPSFFTSSFFTSKS